MVTTAIEVELVAEQDFEVVVRSEVDHEDVVEFSNYHSTKLPTIMGQIETVETVQDSVTKELTRIN